MVLQNTNNNKRDVVNNSRDSRYVLLCLIRLFERRGGGGLSLRRCIASRLCLVIIVSRIFCKNIALFEYCNTGGGDDRLLCWCFVFRISPSVWYVRKLSLGVSRSH